MNNDKKKQELFVKYLKNKYGEENLTDEKIKELKDSGLLQKDYQDFEKILAKKAAHGTKLTYFKTLKNQCAEDEELYYYKKGGSVGCGCKKKEDGGEIQKANMGAVALFKNRKRTKAEQDKINKLSEEDYFAGTADHTKPGISKPKREEPEQPKVTKPKPVTNIKKNSSKNVKTTIQKCGGEVVKKFKAKCGSKIKKHQLGGSLNRIPFYLGGTPEGGIKEKSDNTRVQMIPNNGEGIYETIPYTWIDYVPGVATYNEARRIDIGDPNASYENLIVNGVMDAVGAGMVGPVIKAGLRANRAMRTAKSLGYRQITNHTPIIPSSLRSGTQLLKIDRSKMVKPTGSHPLSHVPNTAIEPTYIKTPYGTAHIGIHRPIVSTRTIPNVDLTPAVMTPLVQTLRVPATAPFRK